MSPSAIELQEPLPPLETSSSAAMDSSSEPWTDLPPSRDYIQCIPIGFARTKGVLGLESSAGLMVIASTHLDDPQTQDVLRRRLARPLRFVKADPAKLLAAIDKVYGKQTGATQELIEKLDEKSVIEEVRQLDGKEDLLNSADRAPVIKLVSLLLFEAVQQQASDIHLHPYEHRLIVRMRIDGVLFDRFDLPRAIQEEVVSRVKVMAKMNIAEKRLPQDGRATAKVGDRVIDLRVSTVPTSHGERVVIRVLDKSVRLYNLGDLGMDAESLRQFSSLIESEHGLILVTGPTGSGKTTTLYAALGQINSKQQNIITLEDPVEYQLDGISQIQISEKRGMTFAGGLRSVLRQDPDIIMIGEIRDRETAIMAIQSALTGHLVFSTLHTNDAASAIARLLDLGIEPYLVASSLIGVLAQRLVRQVCPHCSSAYHPDPADLEILRYRPGTTERPRFRKGVGCAACRDTGYRGRAGCFELLLANEAIRKHIGARADASLIADAARQSGMRSLRDDAMTKAAKGLTTVEEAARLTIRGGD